MEEIINGLKQIKTRVDSGTISTVNGTETLLSKQLEKMIEVAINYTRCCCKLKDKESQAFEDWIDFEGYRDEYNDLLSNGFAYDIGLLHKKHNEFLKHSL